MCDPFDMIGPTLQRLAHLPFVPRAIVDARHPCPMTADVVEHSLDDVRKHPKPIRHHCRGSAPEIMQSPVGHWLGFAISLSACS